MVTREKKRMEGNACYKFSTIKNYAEKTAQKAIEVMVDVGVNIGDITLMMHDYFPQARIYGFEAVKEYYDIAHSRTAHLGNLKLFNKAFSSQHLFADDVGEFPRTQGARLRILKGLPEAGPGWGGGSMVLPEDHELIAGSVPVRGFERLEQDILPVSLAEFMAAEGLEEIDVLKMDCEGCEHSVLGCAGVETLKRLRFIVGEYHGLERFYGVMQKKLFLTHKVNLIGDRDLGSFFAERLDGERDGILKFDKTGMLIPRPWLCSFPIDWHLFNEAFVLNEDRYWHALP
jgi:FkbM family methyltransferase